MSAKVRIKGDGYDIEIGNDAPLAVFAGPCAMESREHALECASALKEISARLGVPLIYKSSFDKANRTSSGSARGIGIKEALPVFVEIREKVGLPVVTDVHEPAQCAQVAVAVDVLQIPAFLCRQTDLLAAAAKTGRVVKIKKGQFLAPWDMKNVVEKVRAEGNNNVLVTERGASFGYNTLVSDFRSIPITDHGERNRLSGSVRHYPFGADARRGGNNLRRAARICANAGARSSCRWRCSGVRGNPS